MKAGLPFNMVTDIIKQMTTLMPTFSKSQKKIAQAILNDYKGTAYITAAKLGAAVGVSESTVVRFAYEMGFKGYPAFQMAIQKSITSQMTSKQRIEAAEQLTADGDILKSVMTRDMEKIKQTLENLDRNTFDSVVDLLIKARRIYIFGSQSSASLASFFNFNLSLMFDKIRTISGTSTNEVFEQMLDIDEHDVLFAITYPRYSAKILGAANYASSEGANIIALTDSAEAPITTHATHVLVAPSDVSAFADSLTAPLSVLNAIIVALVVRGDQEHLRERLDKLESIWEQYNVYAKS